MTWQILQGDNRDTLKTLADNSIDAVVTDPPYGIDFLGKSWDANTGALETYQECLRVLKPGGHILAFSAARTYHHLAMTLERAGFEIRDQIMWIYSSGFPKSQDIGKNNAMPDWQGWGTALKPAHEPIALARKPIKTSIAKNCQQWGVGALNIDATRVPMAEGDKFDIRVYNENQNNEKRDTELTDIEYGEYIIQQPNELGRFPSNVIGDIAEPYQKYFYCPKVSRSERHIKEKIDNNHPTVKPIELMKYLIKLITPPGGIVLDPFNGSGSTGCAAVELGFDYIGCELDPAYVAITEKRITAWLNRDHADNTFGDLFYVEQ